MQAGHLASLQDLQAMQARPYPTLPYSTLGIARELSAGASPAALLRRAARFESSRQRAGSRRCMPACLLESELCCSAVLRSLMCRQSRALVSFAGERGARRRPRGRHGRRHGRHEPAQPAGPPWALLIQ